MSKKQNETPILADEVLGKSEAFVLKNKKTITGTVLAIVVIIVAYLGHKHFILEPQNMEASKAMVTAVYSFEAGNYAESLDGDGINLGTKAIAEEYGNTDAGNLAKAYAGLALAKMENYEEAIEYLSDFDGDDAIVAQKVKHALGNCYAHTGNADKALSLILDAEGLAADGGLYMPENIPAFDWQACLNGSAQEMSSMILSALLPEIPDMRFFVTAKNSALSSGEVTVNC